MYEYLTHQFFKRLIVHIMYSCKLHNHNINNYLHVKVNNIIKDLLI